MDQRAVLSALLRGEPARPDLDWSALLPAATAHGVLGLLAEEFLTHAPAETRPELGALRLRQMRVQALQKEVIAALPCAAVLLKGPSLSERLYGDPFRRASRDLDLLIHPDNLACAIESLQAIGFSETEQVSAAYLRRHHHHITLARPHTPPIEVHFRLIVGFGVALPAEEFLERANDHILTPEDEFLYLAVHAAQHLCSRLIWLEDLRRLRQSQPDLDWDEIHRLAARFRVRLALEFTLATLDGEPRKLALFQRIEKTPLPEPVREMISQTMLCDSPALAASFLSHHSARLLRRRWHRWFPRWAPAEWAS